jgi:predicted phosphodiesterase
MPRTTSTDARAAALADKIARLGLDGADDASLIRTLEARGFLITKDERTERRIKLDVGTKGRIRFAVYTDTHLGSKWQQLTHWRAFMREAKAFGAEFGLHLGDVVDGSGMRRGHEFEVFKHGADAQGKYAAEEMPALENGAGKELPTYVIGGNHDEDFWKHAGANVLEYVTARRPAIHFLGAPQALLLMSGVRLYLLHPKGGTSYARSYKLQKITEQFAPDEKPHIFLAGHWHIPCHVVGYRNVEAMSLPCFQAQTPFLKSLGLAPVVGGLLLDVTYSKRGLEHLATRWITYHRHLEHDYP